MKLSVLDRIEEKYDCPDVVVAPGGWCCCCNCWCHCGGGDEAPVETL
jgi:hypothetical protein